MSLGPNQKLWVDALRSGNYKQIQGTLQDKCGYCCLGVACLVAEQHDIDPTRSPSGTLLGGSLDEQEDVKHWLSLTDRGIIHLMDFNDQQMLNFNQIADEVEKDPSRFFTRPM